MKNIISTAYNFFPFALFFSPLCRFYDHNIGQLRMLGCWLYKQDVDLMTDLNSIVEMLHAKTNKAPGVAWGLYSYVGYIHFIIARWGLASASPRLGKADRDMRSSCRHILSRSIEI